ncbi:MAG TPA: hypothetical protein VF449_12425 [Parvibaculum sp.]
MATMPSRAATFRTALAGILPQVDRLYLYFDQHDEVPAFLRGDPRIVPLLPAQHGALGCDGKMLGLRLHGKPCLYFAFDDDIFYPPAYVELLASALERHHFGAMLGFHALRFRPPHLSYRADRDVLHFNEPLTADSPADELGSGTLAFHTGRFNFDVTAWPHHTMTDLMLAIEAVRQGVPRLAVRRPPNFVRPLEEGQEDSLFKALEKDDSRETAIMRAALAEFPRSWCFAREKTA